MTTDNRDNPEVQVAEREEAAVPEGLNNNWDPQFYPPDDNGVVRPKGVRPLDTLIPRDDAGTETTGYPTYALDVRPDPVQVWKYDMGTNLYFHDTSKALNARGNIADAVESPDLGTGPGGGGGVVDLTDDEGGDIAPLGGAKVNLNRDDFYA